MATIMNGILARRVWELTVPGTVVTCLSDHEWHHCVKSVRCAFSADACCSCSWCMGAKSNAFRSSWTAAWFVSTFLVVTAVRMGLAVTRSECAEHVRPAITVKRSTEDMVVPNPITSQSHAQHVAASPNEAGDLREQVARNSARIAPIPIEKHRRCGGEATQRAPRMFSSGRDRVAGNGPGRRFPRSQHPTRMTRVPQHPRPRPAYP